MSETSSPHRVLHLVVEGFPVDTLEEIASPDDATEVFHLTESSASEALEKIFTADTVAVWGQL